MDTKKEMDVNYHQAENQIATLSDNIVKENQDKVVIEGLEILLTLIGNIFKDPRKEQFRMIKKSNQKIKDKLLSLSGQIHDLIVALGYVDVDEDFYSFVGDYFSVLKRGQEIIQQKLMPLKVKYMTPEEKKKHEILEQ